MHAWAKKVLVRHRLLAHANETSNALIVILRATYQVICHSDIIKEIYTWCTVKTADGFLRSTELKVETCREKTPKNIQYVNDLPLFAESAEELQLIVDTLDRACT